VGDGSDIGVKTDPTRFLEFYCGGSRWVGTAHTHPYSRPIHPSDRFDEKNGNRFGDWVAAAERGLPGVVVRNNFYVWYWVENNGKKRQPGGSGIKLR
jgi:hypothetical protein